MLGQLISKSLFSLAGTSISAGVKGGSLAKSIFKGTVSTARNVFNKATVRKDVLRRGAKFVADDMTLIRSGRSSFHMGITAAGRRLGRLTRPVGNVTRKAFNAIPTPVKRVVGRAGKATAIGFGASALMAGMAGMMSVSVINGMNNAAKDILLERYIQDQRYSRNMLLQSRVGLAMGTNNLNRLGSTMGLSNALSKTRHGANY